MSDYGWVVGAKVSQRFSSGLGLTRWGEMEEVENVYKTGNVVIRGRQHKPIGDTAGLCRGGYALPSEVWVLMTPENAQRRRDDIAEFERRQRAHAALHVLTGMPPRDVPLAVVEAIEQHVMKAKQL